MPDTPDLIMELNDFANHCGYVFNACMQDGIIANNGYNCSHPDQDDGHSLRWEIRRVRRKDKDGYICSHRL